MILLYIPNFIISIIIIIERKIDIEAILKDSEVSRLLGKTRADDRRVRVDLNETR